MKHRGLVFLFSVIIFSCKDSRKHDDNYSYLFDELNRFIKKEKQSMDAEYYYNYDKIKNDSIEIKRYDSLYNVSVKIQKRFNNLDYSDKVNVLKFRDSIALILNSPLKSINEFDYLKLNDSVFNRKMEIDVLNIRNTFHQINIYRYSGTKSEK